MSAERATVVVIDDDPDFRQTMCEVLESEGYAAWSAPSGDAALRRLRSEARAPACILLDLVMPGMSACSFVDHVRREPRFAGTQFVIVTAALVSAAQAGVCPHHTLFKPFDFDHMLRVVRDACAAEAPPAPPPAG